MFFNWNAGQMDRVVYEDTLNRLCTDPTHHIAVRQEAFSNRLTSMCQQEGISELNSHDGKKRSIRAGGTAIKGNSPPFLLIIVFMSQALS